MSETIVFCRRLDGALLKADESRGHCIRCRQPVLITRQQLKFAIRHDASVACIDCSSLQELGSLEVFLPPLELGERSPAAAEPVCYGEPE